MKTNLIGNTLLGVSAAAMIAMSPAAALAAEKKAAAMPVVAVANVEERLEAQHLVENAEMTLQTFARNERKLAEIQPYLKSAAGVVILPELVSGGVGIGGKTGEGIVLRYDKTRNAWSQPLFVTYNSLSLGPQLGIQESKTLAVIMSDMTLRLVASGGLGLGADAAAVAGEKGASADAARSGGRSDLHIFSRSKGAFVGAAVNGGALKPNFERNNAYYGTAVTPEDVLSRNKVMNRGSTLLLRTLSKMAQKDETAQRQ
jgi:lipid-binding SYLF domain-containing protein